MSAAVEIIEPEADARAAMRAIGREARAAARKLANAPAEMKNRALAAAARAITRDRRRFWPPTPAISPTPRRRASAPL